MKVKRLVSILLAALLLVGMIPMNAMALTATQDDAIQVELSLSKSFGIAARSQTMRDDGVNTAAVTAANYKAQMGNWLNAFYLLYGVNADSGSPEDVTPEQAKQNAEWVSAMYKPEGTSLTDVQGGDTVYLGIKLRVNEATKKNGIGVLPIGSFFIKFDHTLFDVPDDLASSIIVNYTAEGINATSGNEEALKKYGAVKWGMAGSMGTTKGSGDFSTMSVVFDSGGNASGTIPNYVIATDTPWDFVIPLKVKAGAKGTTTLEVMEKAINNSAGSFEVATNQYTGNYGEVSLRTNAKKWNPDQGGSASNDVTITFLNTNPDLSVAEGYDKVPTGSTTIKLMMNEHAVTNANTTNANDYWEVYSGTDFGTKGNVDSVSVSGKEVTLTVSGLEAGAVKVVAKNKAFSTSSGEYDDVITVDKGITAVAVPTATVTGNANDGYTVNSTSEGTKIKIKGQNAWIAMTDGSGSSSHKLTDAEIDALIKLIDDAGQTTMADAIVIADKDLETIQSNVSVTIGSKPTALTINYAAETTQETVPNTVETKFTGGSFAKASGATIPLAVDTNGGKDLIYRTAGDTNVLPSASLTLPIPARPTLKVDVVEDETAAKAGATKVNVTGTGAKYELLDASNNGDVSGGQDLSSGVIDGLNADKWLHAQIPASATSFKSNVVNVQGTGWNYVKIDPTSFNLKDEADQTITLTLVGPSSITWVGSESNLTLTKNPSGDSGDFKVKSFSNGAVEFEGTPEKGQDYKLTVAAAAVTGGALNSKAGSSTDVILYGPSDDARNIVSDEFTLNAKVSKGGETKIDLTDQLVGKKIKGVTVTAGNSDVEDVTWTDKVITVKGSDSISGKAEANDPIKLKIEVESIPLQYPTTESVELGDDTEKTIVPTNASDLTGVTVTVTPADSGLTVDADGLTLKTAGENFQTKGNYEFTLTGSNGATAKITITVTGIAATPDFSGLTKTWDDTDSLTTHVTGEVKWKDKDGTELTGTYSGTYKLNNKNVGNTANVDVTEGTFTTDDFEYDVAAGTYDVNVVAAEIASVDSVADVNVTAGNTTTVKKVAEEMAKAEVTTTTDTGATVKAKLGDVIDEDDIKDIIKDKLQQAALPEAEKKAREDWIKEWLAKEENADKTKDEAEAAADAADAEIKAAAKAAVEAEIDDDYVIPGGTDLSIELPYTKADGSQVKAKTNAQLSDNVEEADLSGETISVKATVKKKSTGGGGSYVPNVELETNGFGTPDGPVELDEDGKITKLPGVIGQKLGTVFKGWATQDGNANTIVKVGREITTDTTLYGIFEGYMNGDKPVNGVRTARPSDNVTRGELVTMLVRAVGLYDDSVDYTTTFADAKGAWYTTYVGCAETFGILEGDAEGTARPKDNITREEAAILIAKTFKVDVATGGTTDYVVDFDKTANWAKDYVAAIVNNGTAVGNDHKEYEPKKPITRAEVAAMINKYLGLTAAKKSALTSNSSPFVDVTNSNSWYYSEMLFASLNAPYDYYVTEITYPTR